MVNVLVTGANGQLASCLNDTIIVNSDYNYIFKNSSELDITNNKDLASFFKQNKIKYCINCAAYTAVDKAEQDRKQATKVNVLGAENLAIECSKINAILIHISTDFVFDGEQSKAYNETDSTNPKSVYGQTKLDGELKIKENLSNYFIIRTSWLYSEHGNNFMKTMLRLSKERDQLSIVSDQIGTPTYAKDLAIVILKIIETESTSYGCYHYSNEGVASWYDFAKAIFEIKNSNIEIIPIKTSNYPTPAERPIFSVLNKEKIKDNLGIEIPHWRDSLKKAILNLNNLTN
ncbi:dTDP-4-dehydrorhamnose reductase [Psychroserpens sp. Hel_I_66]|uniref:dTDP-4-dehydrorhamnose reductase n=1 Tax=Psychroserpens sp. Hel_I_66 TaxID=1250004 RepID=UPI000648D104|nr:dTDP-4-dehydrorhamnose reductase [Psychroserpens sp. Hel_I_66]